MSADRSRHFDDGSGSIARESMSAWLWAPLSVGLALASRWLGVLAWAVLSLPLQAVWWATVVAG